MEMSWIQVIVMAFGNLAWMFPLFLWCRSEARADARHFDQETKELRREMIDVMRGFQSSVDSLKEDGRVYRDKFDRELKEYREKSDQEIKAFREMWTQESRDFHGRLCAIAEKGNSS